VDSGARQGRKGSSSLGIGEELNKPSWSVTNDLCSLSWCLLLVSHPCRWS
jgi:hypothetical protein